MDWYSWYVVSWELDRSLEVPFVLRAMHKVLSQAQPLIVNSDRGRRFTSPSYIELLQGAGVQISMDSKGWATGIIFTDRLWRSLKYEEVPGPV